jgi:indoleamine 2,3-dioxygenase
MRRYMPGKHREFLAAVSEYPSLRVFAEAHQSDSSLSTAFDESLKQLRKWRATHIAVVSKYIVRPARQGQSSGTAVVSEKPAELEAAQGEELQGTGGSALVPFLRQSKEETVGLRL